MKILWQFPEIFKNPDRPSALKNGHLRQMRLHLVALVEQRVATLPGMLPRKEPNHVGIGQFGL